MLKYKRKRDFIDLEESLKFIIDYAIKYGNIRIEELLCSMFHFEKLEYSDFFKIMEALFYEMNRWNNEIQRYCINKYNIDTFINIIKIILKKNRNPHFIYAFLYHLCNNMNEKNGSIDHINILDKLLKELLSYFNQQYMHECNSDCIKNTKIIDYFIYLCIHIIIKQSYLFYDHNNINHDEVNLIRRLIHFIGFLSSKGDIYVLYHFYAYINIPLFL